jgi:hypothetical protein
MLVYSRALSANDRILVDNYLHNKYANDICTVPAPSPLKSHAVAAGRAINIAQAPQLTVISLHTRLLL